MPRARAAGLPILPQRWLEGRLGVCVEGRGQVSCTLWPWKGGLTLGVRAGRPGGAWRHHLSQPLLAELVFPASSSLSLSFLSSPQVVFPPGSPIPLRRTFSVLPPPPPPVPLLQHHRDASASNSPPPPSLSTPSPRGPSAVPRGSPEVQSAGAGPRQEDAQGPAPPSPVPHTWRSVGCQTDEDPLFPPMQIQGLEQRADGELAAGWPPNGRQSSPEGQDEGGVSAKAGGSVSCLPCFPGLGQAAGVP